jgi:phosphatidylserine/phosphatidylglycerophosphate/cardiolipin synthase-like enzyme
MWIMRRTLEKLSFLLFTAFLILALPSPVDSKGGIAVAVLFSPTGKKRVIHSALKAEIGRAQRTVDVAMFNYTSRRLAAELKEKAKRCRVRVLFDERTAKKISISVHKDLIKSNVQVKLVHLPGSGVRAAKFHHKFCVVDQRTVMTGSFNWTVSADEVNYENILFIKDKSLASKFTKEFERIWNDPKLAIAGK